jgi:hypothetical protein
MADRKWFKGTAALELDAWYSSGEDVGANLTDARELLESDDSFAVIVEGLSARPGEYLGAERRWNAELFPHPDNDYALQGREFESVARAGYLKAIALALGHDSPVPIKTFWMTGVGNDRFEMHITDEREHVSVTLLVPDVEGGADDRGSPEAWVVTIGDDDQVDVTQTSGPGYK